MAVVWQLLSQGIRILPFDMAFVLTFVLDFFSAYEDGIRPPSDYTTGRLVDDSPFGGIEDMLRSHGLNAAFLEPTLGSLGHSGMIGQSQFSSALNPPRVQDLPDADWMFPLPAAAKKLNCGGEIAHARQRAKDERKWLLVSLQRCVPPRELSPSYVNMTPHMV